MTGLPNTPHLPKEINVAAQGVVQVVWKQSIRAKRLSLRIAPYEHPLIVTIPIGCRPEQALAFVQTNHAWINERLQKLEKTSSFSDKNIISIQGKPYRIMHAPKQHGGTWLEDQYLMVSVDIAFINRTPAVL